jgi:hypothetical protein
MKTDSKVQRSKVQRFKGSGLTSKLKADASALKTKGLSIKSFEHK